MRAKAQSGGAGCGRTLQSPRLTRGRGSPRRVGLARQWKGETGRRSGRAGWRAEARWAAGAGAGHARGEVLGREERAAGEGNGRAGGGGKK